MDILIWILIAAAAAVFTSQLIGVLLSLFMDQTLITGIITAPISGLFLWSIGVTGWSLLVGALAAGFFANAAMKALNRPVAIQKVSRGREW